ncbi:DNA topoisomerase III [Trichophyton equinum CBS 127.97]|uniref:DNA topoisomerase n=1 Tax=Trichophyton equinum (strain ATCC MYA-4606 / CBS 127.97) TaxID=559882 RepID=F2PYM9_TRIEC|nr:DNA topoisomerase III [Trichophyton equinum CBS 127.97]
MGVRTVLCVAEKPSIAKAIANHLGDRVMTHNIQGNPYVKNYEFDYTFLQWGHCSVTMTSVLGHLLSHDFEPRYKSWTSCDPSVLFNAHIEVLLIVIASLLQIILSNTLAGPMYSLFGPIATVKQHKRTMLWVVLVAQ